jgi:ADP-ribose 1''-phosphate phosphatase
MSIFYQKMPLFEAPELSILVHAVNCKGVWGSGVAAEFKRKFPKAFKAYSHACKVDKDDMAGGAMVTELENEHFIGCLFTSRGSGNKDSKEAILSNTEQALYCLLETSAHKGYPFYSNKFNTGKFGVPWKETEKILKKMVNEYNITWIVCEV